MKYVKFTSFDNTILQAYVWDDVKMPKGVVQIVHGMAEHARRYDDFAKFLNANGYIVLRTTTAPTATPKRKTTSDIMRAIFTATPSRTNFLSRNTFPKNTRSPWFFSDTATAVSSGNAILKTTATRSALFCRAARVNPASWWARASFSQTPSQR